MATGREFGQHRHTKESLYPQMNGSRERLCPYLGFQVLAAPSQFDSIAPCGHVKLSPLGVAGGRCSHR